VFGKVASGQEVVNAISENDVMSQVSVEGDYAALLEAQKAQVDEWNRILDG
tara:strand:- start:258 stop:410 length:153 start_codon:yes stop_codon:yes gene_type:complete